MLCEFLLTLAELSTASVVAAEEIEDAVDDEQAVVTSRELLSHAAKDLVLVLAVLGPVDDDVLDGLLWVDCKGSVGAIRVGVQRLTIEALSNLHDTLRAKCAFGVCDRSAAVRLNVRRCAYQ